MKIKKAFKIIAICLLVLFCVYSASLLVLNSRANHYIKYSYLGMYITSPDFMGQSIQEGDGFDSSVTLNSDGSATRYVYYWEYAAYKEYLQENAKEALQKMATDDGYEAFLGVKHSGDLKEITFTIDSAKYKNELGAADVASCVYPAFVYRIACDDKLDENIIKIHLIDQDGNACGDFSYPSDFNLLEIFTEHFENAFNFDF